MKTRLSGKRGIEAVVGLSLAWLGVAPAAGQLAANSQEDFRQEARIEVSQSQDLDRNASEQNQEIRESEFQLGKDLKDVHGNRVRVEQYILRGSENGLTSRQYKHLVLNTRPDLDNQLTQGYGLNTFNKDLPSDVSGLIRNGYGHGVGAPPDYYLTNQEVKTWNSANDTAQNNKDGGILVQNSGGPVYTYDTFFATDKTTINGKDKVLIERIGLGAASEGNLRVSLPGAASTFGVAWDDANGDKTAQLGELNAAFTPISIETSIAPDAYHRMRKITLRDGTWISREDFLVNSEGEIYPRSFALGANPFTSTGASNFYRETILGASEFKSSIDVLWQPAFLWAGEGAAQGNPVN